jgi:shikimate kinase
MQSFPLRIYLVGMPGSGKTTLGKMLANRVAYEYIDLDQLIEQEAGKTIAEIFAQDGEDAFRKSEKAALAKTFQRQRIIVATGGGTPCFYDNMEQINANGLAVFLNIPLAQIANRIQSQPRGQRPLLPADSPDELFAQLQSLYKQRVNYYNEADVAVSGIELTADHVLNKIRNFLEG